MSKNIKNTPYIIHINETVHLAEQIEGLGIQLSPNTHEFTTENIINNPPITVETTENSIEIIHETPETINQQNYGIVGKDEQSCIFQIVYPHDLNLNNPAANVLKRGRPKKKKTENDSTFKSPSKPEIPTKPPISRTRSGRLVKLPKYIEKDFKKIEITRNEQEVQVSDFKRIEEKENSKTEFTELHTKKRIIASQYKCPKCMKAYLGKNRMIQHLKKYPDHGPLPEGYQEFNFDVWNYLFDITQKCKSGQRGIKFCEELSNLLHNVQLLKSALFKTVTDNKNCVNIDKVLGNAIGLTPGKYKFDENELYKDVTVLKLITNSEFFKPNVNNKEVNEMPDKKEENMQSDVEHSENKKIKQNDIDRPILPDNFAHSSKHQSAFNQNIPSGTNIAINNEKQNKDGFNYSHKSVDTEHTTPSKISEQTIENFTKKVETDSQISLHADLLNDNLLLHSLPNTRNSVEELLTSVDNGSNLLDNSTSSDEVMNVDQFVNERFKKIIEPDIELSNTSLNLDLPSLELFQFHTS